MKKITNLASVMLLISMNLFAQKTTKDVFDPSVPVTWLGIDFNNVKLLGEFNTYKDKGEKTPEQIRADYFPGWNNVIVKEEKKYDLEAAFNKKNVDIDLVAVQDINAKSAVEQLFSKTPASFTETDIAAEIQKYNLNKDGLGVVFVMENMDKNTEKASMFVTFIDMASKKVILTKRLEGKAGGFGLKNYWIYSVFTVLRDLQDGELKNMKKAIKTN